MLDFNKHLKEILYQEDFLIVPGLGAFIAKFEQAKLTENGELFGPFKSFDFNGLLNSDDRNKFINYVLTKEGSSKAEIESQLKEFLYNFKSNLSANKKLILAEVCSLEMTSEGELVGNFISELNFYEKQETNFTNSLNVIKDEPLQSAPFEIENFVEKDIDYTEDFEVDYSEKRNWLKYLLYIIPLLLIFGALYSILLYKPFNNSDGVKTDLEVKVDTSKTNGTSSAKDSLKLETVSEPNKVQNDSQSQDTKKPTSNGKFEVSAGIFKNKENAEKLVKRMNEAGFKTEIKLVNGMRRVYVGVVGIEAAEAMSKRIEQFTGDKSVYFDENGISNR